MWSRDTTWGALLTCTVICLEVKMPFASRLTDTESLNTLDLQSLIQLQRTQHFQLALSVQSIGTLQSSHPGFLSLLFTTVQNVKASLIFFFFFFVRNQRAHYKVFSVEFLLHLICKAEL